MNTSFWIFYFICVNVIAFAYMGIDKQHAIKGYKRVPERSLILISLGGGSIGAIAGMYFYHHKTRHAKFKYGLPAILLVQIVIALLVNQLPR